MRRHNRKQTSERAGLVNGFPESLRAKFCGENSDIRINIIPFLFFCLNIEIQS